MEFVSRITLLSAYLASSGLRIERINMAFSHLVGVDLKTSIFIIANLFLLETLLSIDNAAVLAIMVMDLPAQQRSKALRYGIVGAYFFRGLCLVFSSLLIRILWLKVVGGLYLLRLTYLFFKAKQAEGSDDQPIDKTGHRIYKMTLGKLGPFWATVVIVEIMDLAFSIDNVFAAVAFSDKIFLVCLGVFIGILAMRFAAQIFVTLLEKFPFLETTAFIVIGLLGIKLIASYIGDYTKSPMLQVLFKGHHSDLWVSLATVSIFVLPILTSLLFNFPRRALPVQEVEPTPTA
jgi:YkoY family integral membrane protein